MRTAEERIVLLHKRARDLERRRDRRLLSAWGSASAGLSVILLAAVLRFTGNAHEIADVRFTGSSLLDESAGGYVLVAVVSFAAAVLVTVICMRKRQRKKKPPDQDEKRSVISDEEHF